MNACSLCGDVATVARVLEVDGHSALVEADACRERVDVALVAPVGPGALVLCHAGVALQLVTP